MPTLESAKLIIGAPSDGGGALSNNDVQHMHNLHVRLMIIIRAGVAGKRAGSQDYALADTKNYSTFELAPFVIAIALLGGGRGKLLPLLD
jgi:hypothetical protein